MHNQWTVMSDSDRAIFFHSQQRFSGEKFDESKVELQWVTLSFLPDHKLVRATLEPQTVPLANGRVAEIRTPSRSFFLYNPDAKELWKQTIPLSLKSQSIGVVNKLLKPRIDETTVIDYIKFFGMITEYEGHPFYFFNSVDEIPWSDEVSEVERQRLIGAFAAGSPLQQDGTFDVQMSKSKRFMSPETYSFRIPTIYTGQAYSSDMRVARNGAPEMLEDYPIEFQGILPVRSELGYYQVEPTAELRKRLRGMQMRQGAVLIGLGLIIGLPLLFFALLSWVGLGVTVFDLTVGSVFSSISRGLNGWLLDQRWALWLLLFAAGTGIVASALATVWSRWTEYRAKISPGFEQQVESNARDQLQAKHTTVRSRILHVLRSIVLGVAGAILMWSMLMFASHALGFAVYQDVTGDMIVSLRNSVIHSFASLVNWLMRGDDIAGIANWSTALPGVPQKLTALGKAMSVAAFIITPLAISTGILRFWSLTKPEQDVD